MRVNKFPADGEQYHPPTKKKPGKDEKGNIAKLFLEGRVRIAPSLAARVYKANCHKDRYNANKRNRIPLINSEFGGKVVHATHCTIKEAA